MNSAGTRQGVPKGAAPGGGQHTPAEKASFNISVVTGGRKMLVRREKGVEDAEDKETEVCC